MEKNESYSRMKLSDKERSHKELMVSILKGLSDTPLVLKGGTALFLGYGLTRFSEDLDFDAPRKLNLFSKIKNSIPSTIELNDIHIKKDTQTVSRYIVDYYIPKLKESAKLKIEISYRTPIQEKDVYQLDGMRFASIEKLIDYKLQAAYDGETSRSKVRDLYDIHFLAFNYSEKFSKKDAERLVNFSKNPDFIVEKYKDNLLFDNILNGKMDLETLALELSEKSEKILKDINTRECVNLNVQKNNSEYVFFSSPLNTEYTEAKSLGAKWDRELGCWRVSSDLNVRPFLDKGWIRLSDEDIEKIRKEKQERDALRKELKVEKDTQNKITQSNSIDSAKKKGRSR